MPDILIADDHDLVRDTIAAYLENCADFTIHTAGTLDDAFAIMADGDAIDLAILDYEMPGMNGLDGLSQVRKRFQDVKIALISGVASREVANRAMEKGAVAFFPKSISAETMINAIRVVLAGGKYMPVSETRDAPNDHGLSPRELEVLDLLCLGQSNKEIARALGIKPVTATFHVQKIMAKLGASNRTQAAIRAKDQNLV